jgi:ATP-dependent helicase HrpB
MSTAARLVLVTGRGARIQGALGQEEFLVAADLDGGETEARVFLAAPVCRADIESGLAGPVTISLLFSWEGWTPKTCKEMRVGRLLLDEKKGVAVSPADIHQAVCVRLAREGIDALPWNDAARRFRDRCLFVGSYGRHERWPDDPRAAKPTAQAKKKRKFP